MIGGYEDNLQGVGVMYELMVADICHDRWFPVGRCDTFAGLVGLMGVYKLALDVS